MDAYQQQFDINDHGHLLVKRAAFRDDLVGETILDLAAGDRQDWTVQQWLLVLSSLKVSKLKVKDWLLLDHPASELNGDPATEKVMI